MWDKLQLDRYTGPLYRQIIALIESYIELGLLIAGEKLPAERILAKQLKVNRSTVIRALEELTQRGVLVRKLGSGTFVNEEKWGVLTYPIINWHQPVSVAPKNSLYQQKVKQIRVQSKRINQTIYDLANGDLPTLFIPKLSLPQMTQRELIEQESAYESSLSGLLSLKKHIVAYMQHQFAMSVKPEEILITSGTQQSLFLISQGLLKPGDTIGIEAPSYFYSLPLFQAAGLRIDAIESDDEGITLVGLEKAVARQRLKWIFLNPIFQNPTGRSMSGQRKQDILAYCHKHCIGIVEDDAYSALYFNHQVDNLPLKKRDRYDQVIYLGSLSKYIGRHIRLGWMIAPAQIVDKLAEIRQYIDSGLSILPQLLAQDYLAHHYLTHQQQLRDSLYQQMLAMHQWLSNDYPDTFHYHLPQGGLHLYLQFNDPRRETHIALQNQWLMRNILVAQGAEFGDSQGYFRLSYGHFSQDLLL